MHSWGRAPERSGEPGVHGAGAVRLPRVVVWRPCPCAWQGRWELALEERWFQFSPGTWRSHNAGFSWSQSHLVALQHRSDWCITYKRPNQIVSTTECCRSIFKALSLRSSSFPALQCWFVLSLCQSVQALAYNVFFLVHRVYRERLRTGGKEACTGRIFRECNH